MNWRTGNFNAEEDDDQYHTEQSDAYGGEGTYANQLGSQITVQEKVLSKHAARRQRKKNKGGGTVVVSAEPGNPSIGGPIMGDDEPSLGDL